MSCLGIYAHHPLYHLTTPPPHQQVTCKQHAAAVERRVAASTAASLGLSTDKTSQADDYLFDLTLAQVSDGMVYRLFTYYKVEQYL